MVYNFSYLNEVNVRVYEMRQNLNRPKIYKLMMKKSLGCNQIHFNQVIPHFLAKISHQYEMPQYENLTKYIFIINIQMK